MTFPFILAISTSSGVAKVAALADSGGNEVFAEKELFSFDIVDYKSQSAQLLPMIQQHLQSGSILPAHCAAIAVDIGPGGFTSLRTACGVAQGLAVAWNVPTVTLTSFECMLPGIEQSAPLNVLIDARLNEVYAAVLHRTGQGTEWKEMPHLLGIPELAKIEGPVVCDALVFSHLDDTEQNAMLGEVSALQLARLAWQEFRHGRVFTPFDCQPLYVREKVAQTTSERLASRNGTV